jgi:hypothetical protein
LKGGCRICADERRPAVDAALALGRSLRTVAQQFGLSRTLVHRHSRHISGVMERAAARVSADYAKSLRSYLGKLQEEMLTVARAARLAGAHETAIEAVRAGREIAETARKLLTRTPDARTKREPPADLPSDVARRILRVSRESHARTQ